MRSLANGQIWFNSNASLFSRHLKTAQNVIEMTPPREALESQYTTQSFCKVN